MINKNTEGMLTMEEAAVRLKCSVATLYRRIAAGKLHTERVFGRVVVRIEDVDALSVRQRQPVQKNER